MGSSFSRFGKFSATTLFTNEEKKKGRKEMKN
jgi:hypothetical protein